MGASPRCGKSYRRVADTFQKRGYEVRQGDDPEAAYRYLSEDGDSHRLYVLDDPLGGLRLIPDTSAVLDRIRKMISGLHPNRKLIVVQNRHLLTEGMRKERLEDCSLENRPWRDLGVLDGSFLSRVWVELSGAASVSPCSLSVRQEALLQQHFREVILLLDGDKAGRSAGTIIAKRLVSKLSTRLVEIPDGGQPDQLGSDQIRCLCIPGYF